MVTTCLITRPLTSFMFFQIVHGCACVNCTCKWYVVFALLFLFPLFSRIISYFPVSSRNWHDYILFPPWIRSRCEHVSVLLYPFVCQRSIFWLPDLGFCKQFCSVLLGAHVFHILACCAHTLKSGITVSFGSCGECLREFYTVLSSGCYYWHFRCTIGGYLFLKSQL